MTQIEHLQDRFVNFVNIVKYDLDEKNFEWYLKWLGDSSSSSRLKLNQPYDSNAFNSIKYLSGISFDCLNSAWKQVVSVPFLNQNGEIRYNYEIKKYFINKIFEFFFIHIQGYHSCFDIIKKF